MKATFLFTLAFWVMIACIGLLTSCGVPVSVHIPLPDELGGGNLPVVIYPAK